MPKILLPYTKHLSSSSDLVTPYENTRAGFVQMALERNDRAIPFIAEARDLDAMAAQAKTPRELLKIVGIRGALLTASGISDKGASHIDDEGKEEALLQLVERFLEPAGVKFREELVYRFLLTRGDTLGGSMRNVVGALAQRRFSTTLAARLRNSGIEFHYCRERPAVWIPHTQEISVAHFNDIKAFAWVLKGSERVLSYNIKVPVVGKNIDMTLFARSHLAFDKTVLGDASAYLALGELKGGIDPAGADEHWKTANSALNRIRTSFDKKRKAPSLFFVGAAIEQSMADEIWKLLQTKKLSCAANLTVDAQLTALCDWLISC